MELQSRKIRRMTWAPGRDAMNIISPLKRNSVIRVKEEEKVEEEEEEEEGSNQVLSLYLISLR